MVGVLLRKELLELVRDHRSLFLMIVVPLLLYPVLALLSGGLAVKQVSDVKEGVAKVTVVGAELPVDLGAQLSELDTIEVLPSPENPFEWLASQKLDAVLQLPGATNQILQGDGTIEVVLHYVESRELSQRVRRDLEKILIGWSKSIVKSRLAQRGLKPSVARPISISAENNATASQVGLVVMGRILPMLIVMMIVLGAFYPAIEVTAGEKERGTLQTLLTAPISALEIVTGKFLLVFCVSAISGAANILSLGLMLLMVTMLPEMAEADIAFSLSWLQVTGLAFVTVLVGLMFAAIMITVAVLARSFKEAQNYLTPVYFISILPVLFVQLPGLSLEGVIQVVPVINLALLMRGIVESTVTAQQMFVVVTTSIMYTAAVLVVAARIFSKEAILLGDAGLSGLFSGERVKGEMPRPGDALAVTTVVFILLLYIGSMTQSIDLVSGIAISQWLLILTPVLAFLSWGSVDFKVALNITWPPAWSVVAAVLMGSGFWYVISLGINLLVPEDVLAMDSQFKALQEILTRAVNDTPLWALLLVLAISPAVCEEALFRGFLLRAFVRYSKVSTAIWASALLFGVFHMSLIRFVSTMLMGVILAILALRSASIVPAILFHALHNGIIVTMQKQGWVVNGITNEQPFSGIHLGLSLTAITCGALLLIGNRENPEDSVVETPHEDTR